MSTLQVLSSVEALDLTGLSKIDEKVSLTVSGLVVNGLFVINLQGAAKISSVCPQLTSLLLGGCGKLTEAGVTKLLENCGEGRLMEICLPALSGSSSFLLGQSCHGLRSLRLEVLL